MTRSGRAAHGGRGKRMTEEARRRVVVVGGGFAGLFAVRALRRAPVEVTLIDRAEHHLFQPLLYQCATGILSEGKIAAPLREVLRKHANVECVMAEVTGIDPDAREVHARRPLGQSLRFGYDHLIVAAGVQQSYFGHDEFGLFAPGMKSIADALTIRRRVFGAFEMAESATSHDETRHWLTFALVGAGPTGVELAGQIRELATRTLRAEFRRIVPQDARVLLFDGGQAPLASFGPALSAKAATGAAQAGRRAAHALDRDQGRPGRPGGARPGRRGDPARRRHRAVDGRGRGPAAGHGGRHRDRGAAGPRRADPRPAGPDHPGPPGDHGGRRHDEPRRAARGGRGGHAGRAVRGAADPPRAGRPAAGQHARGQAVPLPRPGLGRLRLAGQRGRLGGPAAPGRVPGLVGVAGHPHRLHDRFPQPVRRPGVLVVRVHPGPAPGTHVHQPRRRCAPRRLRRPGRAACFRNENRRPALPDGPAQRARRGGPRRSRGNPPPAPREPGPLYWLRRPSSPGRPRAASRSPPGGRRR